MILYKFQKGELSYFLFKHTEFCSDLLHFLQKRVMNQKVFIIPTLLFSASNIFAGNYHSQIETRPNIIYIYWLMIWELEI